MSAPKWATALLRRLAPPGHTEDVVGDLEEAHERRVRRRGRLRAGVLTGLEAVDMAAALIRGRIRRRSGRAQHTESEATMAGGGLSRLGFSWLDAKLGLRMLIKYPGLTLVGGLGIAVAIAIGAGFFDVAAVVHARLPFEEGERVVAIENWDTESNNQERRILHDFVVWRDELRSIEDLGAYRRVARNLIIPGGETELVSAAEMTASGFALTRVPALLGRPLMEEDEREGAPPVVVIGHDVWRRHFDSDPGVVGREVRLGSTIHTVVGVMPEGFAFPISHRIWVPFRVDAADHERRQGPGIYVFGRLAPGATLESAQAELTTIAHRLASAFPETHERLRPRVMPYTIQLYDDMEGVEIPLMQTLIVMLLVIVCVNIAILVYARTATRQSEIAVRNALGASRRRVIAQLFVEALVFSALSAMVGLGIARVVLRYVYDTLAILAPGGMPFWIEFKLSTGTIVYVVALTVFSALIVGVLPALKATGRRVQVGLQRRGTGASGLRLGRTWTALVVFQVAIAVSMLPIASFFSWQFLRFGMVEPGHPTEEFLTARLSLERESWGSDAADMVDAEPDAAFAMLQAELVRRLDAEPSVSEVVLTQTPPGEEGIVWVEVEGVPTPAGTSGAVREGTGGHRVGTGHVTPDYFDAFDVPLLAGRQFNAGDLGPGTTAVVANRAFVQDVLAGANALGRRFRYVGRGGDVDPDEIELRRWYEIVGVVEDFPNRMDPSTTTARLYHPAGPDVAAARINVINIRVRGGDPTTFAGRLREVATALDPRLQLREILSLDTVLREEQRAMQLGAIGIGIVMLSVLLLAAAGLYALMSFAVSRRRREIGIRAALGAHPRRLLLTIFARALAQLATGIVLGLAAVTGFDLLTDGELLAGRRAFLLPGVAVFMLVVGLLATVGPARRGLRIQPTEALKADA